MQCPYFKNINFEKITELQIQESCFEEDELGLSGAFDEVDENLNESRSSDPFYSASESIPEEGKTGSLNNYELKTNQMQTQKMSQNCIESTNIIPIKMPKIMNVKGISSPTYKAISVFVEQPTQNTDLENVINTSTHVFQTRKMTQLNIPCTLYRGEVTIINEKKSYNCHLEKQVLRITYQIENAKEKKEVNQKIRFFVDLKKINFELKRIDDTSLTLQIIKKKKICEELKLQFFGLKEANIFEAIIEECKKDHKYYSERLTFEKDPGCKLSEIEDSSVSQVYDSLGFTVERMSYNNIFNIADTFDIVLFRNKNLMSKMQRFFTNSDFDHVALLMRTIGNQLLMLEATSNAGVAIYSFYSLRKLAKNKHFARLAIKRYMGQKKYEHIRKLQTFVQQVNGTKYKFDPLYLFSSSVAKTQEKTFFCSELVAEALQTAGIMKRNKPPYKFLPKHFNDEQLNGEIQSGYYSDVIVIE